jgi:(+)-trans-carveol dehydrogenase
LELAPDMIRVNSLHPTTVGTDMILNDPTYRLFRPDLENPSQDDATEAFMSLNALPVKWVEAQDISNALLFLASDEGRYITGVTLPVDAGALAK